MIGYIGRRILALIPLLVIISFVVFSLVLLLPGDPARQIAGGANADEATVQAVREKLHLDEPFFQQYGRWASGAATGDLGDSWFEQRSVASEIANRFPVTLSMVIGGVAVALMIGVPLGLLAGSRPGSAIDRLITGVTSFGVAMPDFWLAIILVTFLAVNHQVLPSSGYVPFTDDPWEWARHLVMPWIAIGIGGSATIARQLRGALADELGSDYARTARAKGLSGRRVTLKHALKNAAMPAVTVLGIQIAYALGGTVIMEQIFGIPGMGSYALQALGNRDLPVIQGVVMLTAVIFLVMNLLVDIVYAYLNPKVRLGAAHEHDGARAGRGPGPGAPPPRGDRRGVSPRRDIWRRFRHNRVAFAALAFLGLLLLLAVLAPLIAPYGQTAKDTLRINEGPSRAHWLGTDDIGQDVLSRVLYGARVSLRAAFQIVGMALVVALPVGLVAGFVGGRLDGMVMRTMDAFFAFPPLLFALAISGLLGPGLDNAFIAIAVVFVPGFVRLIRGQVLAVREETYVEASRAVGVSTPRMLRRHILPNIASPLVVQVALSCGFAILAEAGLSFLGYGAPLGTASWGTMLRRAYDGILITQWPIIPPGVALLLTVLAFNLVGDGLRDALGRGGGSAGGRTP